MQHYHVLLFVILIISEALLAQTQLNLMEQKETMIGWGMTVKQPAKMVAILIIWSQHISEHIDGSYCIGDM